MKKLDLFDVSIHEKDWKAFRKSATQEELLILGIGSMYRLISKRLISYLSALGIILSVIIGVVLLSLGAMNEGIIILVVGYVLFSFLATKCIRYRDSYNQIRNKLNKENRMYLQSVFKVNAGLAFFDALMYFIIAYITLFYQALMLFIGMFAPNFVIAKNGVLISIPKGYEIGNLEAIGGYYASYSLLDDWQKTSYENSHKYVATFTNNMGCSQTVHSADGKNFYNEDGSFAGTSNDNGKTIIPK